MRPQQRPLAFSGFRRPPPDEEVPTSISVASPPEAAFRLVAYQHIMACYFFFFIYSASRTRLQRSPLELRYRSTRVSKVSW